MEIWKPIPSQPWWLASSEGRVSMPKREQKMPRGGHRYVEVAPTHGFFDAKKRRFRLSVNGTTRWVAPLICEAFHGLRPSDKHQCMHLDEDSANNRSENLAWGTRSENMSAPGHVAKCRERTKNNKLAQRITDEQRSAIVQAKGVLRAKDVAVEFGLSRARVYQIWAAAHV